MLQEIIIINDPQRGMHLLPLKKKAKIGKFQNCAESAGQKYQCFSAFLFGIEVLKTRTTMETTHILGKFIHDPNKLTKIS